MNQIQRLSKVSASAVQASRLIGSRLHIEDIYPLIDCGRFPVKRIAGEPFQVWADIFRDGHDVLAAELKWRRAQESSWNTLSMQFRENDRWCGTFIPEVTGRYVYAIEAWTDRFATWRRNYLLKRDAGEDITSEFLLARQMLDDAISEGDACVIIKKAASRFDSTGSDEALLSDELAMAMTQCQSRPDSLMSPAYPLTIDRPRARAGAWYELFPRSQGTSGHGTFDDCIRRIPEIAAMGFDVLYMPPIHPIGTTNRKGKNNALVAAPDDPGSPYAIGGAAGGHDAVHPQLGTLRDFRRLVESCAANGMEVALDFAVQCSPDHPWIREHPEWFQWQLDGSIRYAENPPKKYQDIVNPDLYCERRAELWTALRDIVLFWREQGVKIFRVDNPHTKAFPFWEWLIAEVQSVDSDIIFLSEAFTRPKIMKALAKIGFTQSYTYFTWRTTKAELSEYISELTSHPVRDYFRPNFFVNTPDILPFHLQAGEPWMFKSRVALAATLSSSYGVYSGYELLEHAPLPGKEEYLDSEKYEIKPRDWRRPGNINHYVTRLNEIRRVNPALLQTGNIRLLQVDDADVIGFVKESVTKDNAIAAAITLAPGRREFWLHFGNLTIGSDGGEKPVVALENLITGERLALEWGGVRLTIDADQNPALLFRCVG